MATHPENTLPGFLYAIEAGADGVELDIAVGDGESLVVTHDPPVAGRDYPSLDEVLALESPPDFVFESRPCCREQCAARIGQRITPIALLLVGRPGK